MIVHVSSVTKGVDFSKGLQSDNKAQTGGYFIQCFSRDV